MKIRILNGGHAAVVYPTGVLGIELVDQAMANPRIRGFLEMLGSLDVQDPHCDWFPVQTSRMEA